MPKKNHDYSSGDSYPEGAFTDPKSSRSKRARTKPQAERRIRPSKTKSTGQYQQLDIDTVTEAKPEKSRIQKRVEEQHEGYDRSRIHQNVHKESKEIESKEDMMDRVRDLIVCGYPTEIPGQRDFVKEGEDFLANLGARWR